MQISIEKPAHALFGMENCVHSERGEAFLMDSSFREKIARICQGEVRWDCPMSGFSTFRVGGPADAVIFPKGLDALSRLVKGFYDKGIPWCVVGRGSNILVADTGIRGVVIVLGKEFSAIEPVETPHAEKGALCVRAEAGSSLAGLLRWAKARELTGLEFVAGIPGSVGGAIVMNAGAWGKEIGDVLTDITVIEKDGTYAALKRETFPFTYRTWGGGQGALVAAGTFLLHHGRREEIEAACRQHAKHRKERQPIETANAGSFFKNPKGQAAGRLIEEAGLKGLSVGGAMVSPRHANFIVNAGDARAQDIFDLMHLVQEKVLKQFGVKLEPEVRLLGAW